MILLILRFIAFSFFLIITSILIIDLLFYIANFSCKLIIKKSLFDIIENYNKQ